MVGEGNGEADLAAPRKPEGKRRPSGIPARREATEAEFDRARAEGGRIRGLHALGLSASKIGKELRLPVVAVEHILDESPAETKAPTAAPVETAPPRFNLNEPFRGDPNISHERNVSHLGGPATWTPAAPATQMASEPTTEHYLRAPPIAMVAPDGLRREMGFATPEPSPAYATGVYETGTTSDLLFQILTENGVQAPKARGIVRRFGHYSPNQHEMLRRILSTAGLSVPVRDSVSAAYREETEGDAGGSAPSDPFSGFGGNSSDPLSTFGPLDAENDRAFVREMKKRAIEADVIARERRARGLDSPSSSPAPALSSAESESVRLLREQLELTKRELLETRHASEIARLRDDLTRQIDEIKRGGQPPSASEVEARTRAELNSTITKEIARRSQDAGVLPKTIRDRLASDPSLQKRVMGALDDVLPPESEVDARARARFGDGHVQPSEEELEALTARLAQQNNGPPEAGSSASPSPKPDPGAPKIRRLPPGFGQEPPTTDAATVDRAYEPG